MSSEYSKGTLLLLATKELTRPSVILVKYTVTAVSMLRSVGMQKGGFRRMMCYECLIYGLRSILYGVILSLLVSFLIYRVLAGGMEIPDPSLEDRKRSLAQSEKIYRSADHADTCVIY